MDARSTCGALALLALAGAARAEPGSFRAPDQPVEPAPDGLVLAEAEEFHVTAPGWRARPWGENLYAATFANTFLSRKAFLGAPPTGAATEATILVRVPAAGRYLALVRYEAAYRFETRFTLRIEQAGEVRLEREYGARQSPRVWAFGSGVQPEVAFPWGAVENVVWEGHEVGVTLAEGLARLTLVAGPQSGDAASRNVDLVLLTRDEAEVRRRIAEEGYLPLDGLLTQAGDLHLRVRNHGPALALTISPGVEHSPYWVHRRAWAPRALEVEAGETSGWVEVGSLLDSLNDGAWQLKAAPRQAGPLRFDLELALRGADGELALIRSFEGLTGDLALAYDADTRYSRRIRALAEVTGELVAALEGDPPPPGRPPALTPVYATTVEPLPGDARHAAAAVRLRALLGVNASGDDGSYIDVRDQSPAALAALGARLAADGRADRIRVVSLGDEIALPAPPLDSHEPFRAWLRAEGLTPAEVDPAAGDDWSRVRYDPQGAGPLRYHARRFGYRWGEARQRELTDALRPHLPRAGFGANFSPHRRPAYLGPVHHWISIFRADALTMPWGEDYAWQVPVASQQLTGLVLDMFRAGVARRPDARIHWYVMPHAPGNTPAGWRRQLYTAIAHGAKVLNLFELRPVQTAYTENHCSDPAMYRAIRRGLHELGTFEDLVQEGRVRPARVGLWFSEAADVWEDDAPPFAAAKRCLYLALRHQQLPLDVVVEGDDLGRLDALFVTDRHLSRAATRAIAAWVEGGGRLVATAGAGLRDELDRPNEAFQRLLGLSGQELELAPGPPVELEKQDLPFTAPMGVVRVGGAAGARLPVVGARARLELADGTPLALHHDGAVAASQRAVGRGRATALGFLPGLSCFLPAIPRRPVDRGASDDSMAHFIPTAFDPATRALLTELIRDERRPVACSEPLVETTVLEAPGGLVIPLVNWSGAPARGLRVTVALDVPTGEARLASGGAVTVARDGAATTFTFDLEVADALVLRRGR